MSVPSVAVLAGAVVLTLALTPLAAVVAARRGIVDRPGPLKPQRRPVPYLGGIGLACGASLGVAVFRPWLLVPLVSALALGTADDVRPLSPRIRLVGQVAVGALLAAVSHAHGGGLGAYVVLAVATVVLINACNMLDGLDALLGSLAVVTTAGFAFILTGDTRLCALALCGSAAAFLVFNRPPARVYLGDGGSYFIGTAFAGLLAAAWAPSERLSTGIASLALVAIPVAELGVSVLRRARAHRSLFAGDRDHPYDVLVRRGWSTGRVVTCYSLVALILAGVALVASTLRTSFAALLLVVVGTALLFAVQRFGVATPEPKHPGELAT